MKDYGKKVYKIGINDVDYSVSPVINGKQTHCPFYKTWKRMLERGYSEKLKKKYPTYIGVSVCEEWLLFSNFKAWMETQDWEGKHLDKDILVCGNKVYSPETCVFIPRELNNFILSNEATRGEWPLGVYRHKKQDKFQAHCKNPFTNRKEYLGSFTCPLEAHKAWKAKKHEHACSYADMQTDQRVAEALRVLYRP